MSTTGRDISVEIRIDGDPWQPVESLEQAGPQDAVYLLDRQTGQVRFGDGQHGRRPQGGSTLSATYRFGGGASGNVAAYTLAMPASGLPDGRWLNCQIQPDSITLYEHLGYVNGWRWRLLSWLCRWSCQLLGNAR